MALTKEEIKWATILALTTPPLGMPVSVSVPNLPQEEQEEPAENNDTDHDTDHAPV